MNVRLWLGIIGLTTLAAFACTEETTAPSSSSESPTQTATSTPLPSPTPAPTSRPLPTPSPEPTPKPVIFDGSGAFLTPPFDLRAGVVLLEAQYDGDSNFIVQMLAEDGSTKYSINAIGAYKGTRAHQVNDDAFAALRPGSYRIQVQADGQWQIEVTQPQWAGAPPLPLMWSGRGDDVIGPIAIEAGITPASLTHGGSGNFIVQLVSVDGARSDYIVNEIGQYDGSQAIRAQDNALIGLVPGLYVMVIQADGDWTVELGDGG